MSLAMSSSLSLLLFTRKYRQTSSKAKPIIAPMVAPAIIPALEADKENRGLRQVLHVTKHVKHMERCECVMLHEMEWKWFLVT